MQKVSGMEHICLLVQLSCGGCKRRRSNELNNAGNSGCIRCCCSTLGDSVPSRPSGSWEISCPELTDKQKSLLVTQGLCLVLGSKSVCLRTRNRIENWKKNCPVVAGAWASDGDQVLALIGMMAFRQCWLKSCT